MKTINFQGPVRTVLAGVAMLLLVGCSQERETTAMPDPAENMSVTVPITTDSEMARNLYLEGRAMLDDLLFLNAHEKFREAIAVDPGFAMAHAMAANTAQSAEEFFAHVGHARESAPGASEGEQLFIAALVAASENDQTAQGAALEKLVASYPKDPRTHMWLGNFQNGQQDFADAIAHYTHSTELDPKFAPAFNSLGYAYRAVDDLDSAKSAFEKYVALLPNEANPHDSYAELLMEMGDYENSIKHYQMALDIDPNFAASYAGISTNYSLMDQPENSKAAADLMLASARNFAERQNAMFESVKTHLFAGDRESAMGVCRNMVAEAEEQRDLAAAGGTLEYMGDISLHADQPGQAEQHYTMALDSRQKSSINDANKAQAKRNHLYKMALAAIVADDAKLAADRTAEYTTAVKEHGTASENRRVHELAGYLAMMNDNMVAAAEHLAEASQFDPNVLYWSARAQDALGEKDKARDLATRAAKRNTLSPALPLVRRDALDYLEKLNET